MKEFNSKLGKWNKTFRSAIENENKSRSPGDQKPVHDLVTLPEKAGAIAEPSAVVASNAGVKAKQSVEQVKARAEVKKIEEDLKTTRVSLGANVAQYNALCEQYVNGLKQNANNSGLNGRLDQLEQQMKGLENKIVQECEEVVGDLTKIASLTGTPVADAGIQSGIKEIKDAIKVPMDQRGKALASAVQDFDQAVSGSQATVNTVVDVDAPVSAGRLTPEGMTPPSPQVMAWAHTVVSGKMIVNENHRAVNLEGANGAGIELTEVKDKLEGVLKDSGKIITLAQKKEVESAIGIVKQQIASQVSGTSNRAHASAANAVVGSGAVKTAKKEEETKYSGKELAKMALNMIEHLTPGLDHLGQAISSANERAAMLRRSKKEESMKS